MTENAPPLATGPEERGAAAPERGAAVGRTGLARVDPMRPALIRIFFLGVMLATAALLFASTYLRPNTFTTLDWAINYADGFVRRGLVGAVLLPLSEATGIAMIHLIFALNLALYATFLGAAYLLIAGLGFPATAVLLVYSPFFVTYQVSSWASAGRKEIAFLAAFALLCLALSRARTPRGDLALFGAFAVAMPALVLVHEATAFFAAWALAAAIALGTLQAAPGRLALMALPTLVAFAAVVVASADEGTVEAICAALSGRLGSPRLENACATTDTAVVWLMRETADGIGAVGYFLPQLVVGLPAALILIGLAFVPLAGALEALPEPTRRRFWIGSGIAAASGLPLYLVAFDWGRFVAVQAICFALVLLAVLARHRAALDVRGWVPGVALVLVYALFWSVQYKPLRFEPGYTSLIGGGYFVDYTLRISSGFD